MEIEILYRLHPKNISLYEVLIRDKKDVTIIEVPYMNHWFQECETGAFAEYGIIEQTISPSVLEIITQWIQQKTF